MVTIAWGNLGQNYILQWIRLQIQNIAVHYYFMKNVHFRSFSGPYFLEFGLNTYRKNSDFGHFSRSAVLLRWSWTFYNFLLRNFFGSAKVSKLISKGKNSTQAKFWEIAKFCFECLFFALNKYGNQSVLTTWSNI